MPEDWMTKSSIYEMQMQTSSSVTYLTSSDIAARPCLVIQTVTWPAPSDTDNALLEKPTMADKDQINKETSC